MVDYIYLCDSCGQDFPQFYGFCPNCKAREPLKREIMFDKEVQEWEFTNNELALLKDVSLEKQLRISTDIEDLDRVLGGGILNGMVILLGGEPGIGKSTLLIQMLENLAKKLGVVLYVSGEESPEQIKNRSQRIGIIGANIQVLSSGNIHKIFELAESLKPKFIAFDSIQTLRDSSSQGAQGSINQIRDCGYKIINFAKSKSIPVLITGHVTKDGNLAGPKLLEHMVDTVLYMEGDRYMEMRILRVIKNRFGPDQEIGLFQMQSNGLKSIDNLSLSMNVNGNIGSGRTLVPIVEGSRCFMVEIQALTSKSFFTSPRRIANGFDFNRLIMLVSVLGKNRNINVGGEDIVINLVGGIDTKDPGVDLGVIMAIASSYKNKKIGSSTAFLGEVGLGGEIRNIRHIEKRLHECNLLGVKTCFIPEISSDIKKQFKNSNLQIVTSIDEVFRKVFSSN